MFNGFHGQSGSAKSGGFLVYFFFLSLISGVRIMFIGCKVVASNARWYKVMGKDYEEQEMFKLQDELQISLLPFEIGADMLLL